MAREFYQYIKSHAEKNPGHPAIIDGDSVLTYGDLLERVEQFAGALENLDRTPDSKLGILCLNQKEYLIAFLGALLKGLPTVPINFLLSPEDKVYIAQNAGIDAIVLDSLFLKPETAPFFKMFKHRILVGEADLSLLGAGAHCFEEFLRTGRREDAFREYVKDPAAPDVLLYTAGTTSRPKGVMLEEEQFDANSEGVLAHIPVSAEDRVIVALPLFHSFGNIMALLVLRVGGTLVLIRQFQPKTILGAIARHQATILPLVPTIYSFLVELYCRGGYDVSSLRYCISGAASLPEALLKRVEETLGVTVIEGYGLTETSPVIAVNKFADGSVPSSVGPVLPNVEIKIVDEAGQPVPRGEVGEIWVRGETVMKGYWKLPKENAETLTPDGWLKTGDLGHMDAKNRLYISAGRKKDLIIRAGENISPLAIENALMNHPAVAEVAAVGVPDERVGEKVKVCVAFREGATAGEKEIKDFCRKKLPPFMIPDIIQRYESLPKNAAGKILKTELRRDSE